MSDEPEYRQVAGLLQFCPLVLDVKQIFLLGDASDFQALYAAFLMTLIN